MTDEEITTAYEHFDFMVNCARLRGAGEDAEDVAQEAWASLLPTLRTFTPETDDDLLRLLLGTVKRRVIDYLRRRNTQKRDRHRVDPEAYDSDEPPMPEDEPLSAEEQVAGGQIAERFWARAAERLPAEWVEVFRRVYEEGVEIKMLAKERGVSYRTFHRRFVKYEHQLAGLLASRLDSDTVTGSSRRVIMTDDERVKVTVRLKPALVKRAQHYAIDRDTTLQALVEQALEALLKGKGR